MKCVCNGKVFREKLMEFWMANDRIAQDAPRTFDREYKLGRALSSEKGQRQEKRRETKESETKG